MIREKYHKERNLKSCGNTHTQKKIQCNPLENASKKGFKATGPEYTVTNSRLNRPAVREAGQKLLSREPG